MIFSNLDGGVRNIVELLLCSQDYKFHLAVIQLQQIDPHPRSNFIDTVL